MQTEVYYIKVSGHIESDLRIVYACSVLGVRPIINMLPRSSSTSTSLLPSHVLVWTHLLYAQTHSLDVNKSYGSREGKHVHVPSVGPRGHIFYLFPLQTLGFCPAGCFFTGTFQKNVINISLLRWQLQRQRSVAVTFCVCI